ncbi:Platinum sensitivity protein [Lobosporangium transversale]|uniref:Component of IIS longevity pathway SMK-1-domain-containing protein n=1 Tax=Lobosporangium transversale TaxID=64571 RepID=A0A1Y2GLC5_9FUNG|nr:component of IIS longevity pathway SMK-1-domain-containing protein [Lobosporangium transversale]KAF9915417.1 Platinum sensitivity protein [Lobosporangium transversale]ORZ14369.1 component of IIS longevity pathway SMK-1-domain-containing protein [Lobosporangium transversale]|eukprot:XP_021880847.1 component of IIS longevity pathway SMK-1-domain-containing protein [Lobosporangium transversale]
MESNAKMRVKVYKLSTGNQWIDQGTGHCSCEFNLDKSEGTLIVHSEDEEDKILLRTRIRVGEDLYQRQQETLIVWSEDDGEDLALSFQEAEGCGEIWDNINEVQQHYAEDLFSDPSDANGAGSGDFITLPDPDISNLAEIEILIKEAQNGINEKEKLAGYIIIDNYIDKLFPILETCEDLESRSDLHLLHGIMLGIIMLNDIAIIQYILKDEIIIGCLGMLEYDPELGDQKQEYREFLTKRSKYKQIVPINDPEVEQKIHQAYRLHFLRDTVLARFADEHLSSILGSLIFFHNIDIVTYIHQDRAFLKELFGILENDSEPLERKRDVILFVQQVCSIAKTTQLPTRAGLYRTLSQTGLFNLFEAALSDTDPKIKMAGTEIFMFAMEYDPNLIRAHIVRQAEEKSSKQLMDIILDQFLGEEDMGIKLQYSETIRLLLDTNTSQGDNGITATLDPTPNLDPDSDKFLELFYGPYIGKFVSPLLELSEGKYDATVFSRSTATVCENICQILSFIVRNHTFRSKYYVLSSGVVSKVCVLLKNRDQHLRLSALRFFRTCIGMNDDFYHRYLIKQNIIQYIVDMLLSTNNKNNLLNSACIEFFDYIRNENIKSLISHIVPLYGDKFKDIEYVNTFKALIRRYEQQQDTSVADAEAADAVASEASATKRVGLGQKAWSSSTMDDDEEAYFNNSDDEDEVPNESKQEDDPPTSDLRRRVKESSDDDSGEEHEGHDLSGNEVDKGTEPVLASQTSPPPPPTLMRRKLVDYLDDDDNEEEWAFNRSLRKPTSPASPPPDPTSTESPEKKIKLDSEQTGGSHQDQLMGDVSNTNDTPGTSLEGSNSPIKFKLNSLRNGRSPSPLSSSSPKSRSVSPLSSGLPPVATRTGIAFVKASSVDTESHSSDSESGSASIDKTDMLSAAAIHLRSDMARDFKRLADEEEKGKEEEEEESLSLNGETQVSSGDLKGAISASTDDTTKLVEPNIAAISNAGESTTSEETSNSPTSYAE